MGLSIKEIRSLFKPKMRFVLRGVVFEIERITGKGNIFAKPLGPVAEKEEGKILHPPTGLVDPRGRPVVIHPHRRG